VQSRNTTRDRQTPSCAERVTADYNLPHVEIEWTKEQLEDFARLASQPPAPPTPALIRAMKRNRTT
jgi:hypothetical protein